jgi:vacuolar-type H+-ATPase subunit H
VSQARDFLDRFRPAGAPGPAARAGVPADRARELAAELEPVLALLDGTYAECQQIIETARREADGITAHMQAEVTEIGQEAARQARTARDEAAAEVLVQARAEASAAAADASQQVRQIRRLAQRRLPVLVTRAAGLVQAGLSGLAGPAGSPPGAAPGGSTVPDATDGAGTGGGPPS